MRGFQYHWRKQQYIGTHRDQCEKDVGHNFGNELVADDDDFGESDKDDDMGESSL